MSDKVEKLKNFLINLNNVQTTEEIQVSVIDLFRKDCTIKSFWNETVPLKSFAAYYKTLCANFENPNDFIDGKPLLNSEKIVYPIMLDDQILAALEVISPTKTDIKIVEIIIPIIALKMENIHLTDKIDRGHNFNNAMKNISKIIESQYELRYIIPIIGEILDTFIENHLIYIFLKQGSHMKLVWPANCLDKKITAKVTKIATEKDVTYSKDHLTAYFPMINENTNVGYIVTKSTEGEIVPQEVIYLEELAKQAATTITRAKVYGEILKYATLDALTGFYNRRQLDERVKQEVSIAKRKKTSLCAIMADIDFFKQVNDTYGHAAGDTVLKEVSKIMRAQLREYDIAARYGGEEFVILLPDTSVDEAEHVAERLRQTVSDKVINIEKVNNNNDTKTISVSISIGICAYNPKWSAADFIMCADNALYQAKDTGRNRIVFYEEKI